MTDAERLDAMKSELQYLRAEMDLNRKYVFERPVLIVTAGITAAATLKGIHGFDILPVVFSTLIGFNLWFTYNRLQSNARLISYLQVVHTPSGVQRWIGWEAGLSLFRSFAARAPEPRDEMERASRSERKGRENRFYGPILSFHLIAAVGLTGFLLAQAYPDGPTASPISVVARTALVLDALALAALGTLGWFCRPGRVRHTIGETRAVWEKALPQNERAAIAPSVAIPLSLIQATSPAPMLPNDR